MRSNEFGNGIVSQIGVSFEVTCTNTDTIGLFEKTRFIAVANHFTTFKCHLQRYCVSRKYRFEVTCTSGLVYTYVSLTLFDTVDVAQLD